MILLFLGDWRPTLVICDLAFRSPSSVSIILLGALGETINIMTLGGLALAVGILVDDATVEIENIERNLAMGKEMRQAILDGAQQIAVPAFVSTLCICIVFVPMFFLTGVARFLFVPLAEAVSFAMLASYLLSRTLIPTLVMYIMRGHEHRAAGAKDLPRTLPARLRAAASKTSARGYQAAAGNHARTARVFVACLPALLRRCRWALLFFLGQDFFPQVDAGLMRLHVRGAPRPAGGRDRATLRRSGSRAASARSPQGDLQTDPRQYRPALLRHQPVLQHGRARLAPATPRS